MSKIAPTQLPQQRDPTVKDEKHCDFIRTLPCCICNKDSECAHVRYADAGHGKVEMGMGRRDDRYTVPLCPDHHRLNEESQHANNERGWWLMTGLNPLIMSAELWRISGNTLAAYNIITRHKIEK